MPEEREALASRSSGFDLPLGELLLADVGNGAGHQATFGRGWLLQRASGARKSDGEFGGLFGLCGRSRTWAKFKSVNFVERMPSQAFLLRSVSVEMTKTWVCPWGVEVDRNVARGLVLNLYIMTLLEVS